jgi:hypothetical protein
MVQNPKHILYGGMAETAVRNFVVPRLASTGMYKNVLTDNEKEFLEQAMGLEPNALSIYKKKDNFWDDSNPVGIGRVTLHKQDNYLDLSIPEDYIRYKILLSNKDQIASSLRELEDHPKATYQFVIISENAETQMNLSRMDATKRCYMEYGKIEDKADVLKTVIETITGKPLAANTKLDFLQNRAWELIEEDPRIFLSVVQDPLLSTKVLIYKCIDAGLISKKVNYLYLRSDNTPLCEGGEEPVLSVAARYLNSPKRQELKLSLEAKLKQ